MNEICPYCGEKIDSKIIIRKIQDHSKILTIEFDEDRRIPFQCPNCDQNVIINYILDLMLLILYKEN